MNIDYVRTNLFQSSGNYMTALIRLARFPTAGARRTRLSPLLSGHM